MLETITKRALSTLKRLDWTWPLLTRITLGVLFASTGWGKAHSLEKVTAFFTELNIPMPGLNAVVVAYSELVCGTLLVLGLGTRLATIPLIVSMIVALLTAKLGEIHGLPDLFGEIEFTYVVMLISILVAGPGRISLDTLVGRRLFKSGVVAGTPVIA
jgi:putative oxidoreductase